jgi:pimeloyl-ACP methyl ester carboxylesterase
MQLAHELVGPLDGPSIVLVHGITESRHTWRSVIDALQVDHRVLAVDLRGHGQSADGDTYDPISYATDVVETASANGLHDPLVVGHSLGGVVAAAYGSVGSCCGIIDVDQPLRLSGFKADLAQLEPMLKGTHNEFLAARALMFSMMDGPLPAAERDRFEAFGRPDQQVVLGTWAAVFDSTVAKLDEVVEALTAGITVPFLSLHGIDPGGEYAIWLTGLVPTATVEVWDAHGHYPHLVDTPRFLTRLAAFEQQVRG